jgi:hypothetical protein
MAERLEPRNSAVVGLHRTHNSFSYQNMHRKMSINEYLLGILHHEGVDVEVNLYSLNIIETLDTATHVLAVFLSRPFS